MILADIAAATKRRVAACKRILPLDALKATALALPTNTSFAFEAALRGKAFNLIGEVKKASPSKGIIAADFPYLEIAKDYELAGVAAISVLTEPEFFLGCDRYLKEIKACVNIPVLRKDFIIDEYQIYEAKLLGADAVLLICALLDTQTLGSYIKIADSLGISALVETHDATEIHSAAAAGARIIGVNNRNLQDFTVDMQTSLRLRSLVPDGITFIAESGIKTAADIAALKAGKITAALIGETLIACADKIQTIRDLLGEKPCTKLKICGLTKLTDIAAVNRTRPDYIGFVFAPSRRQITLAMAKKLKAALNPTIQVIGVFVNAPLATIITIEQADIIDIIQLHGDETETYINKLKALTAKPIIKTVRINDKIKQSSAVDTVADYLLFDTYSRTNYGGTGEKFNWNTIENCPKPFFLAGGIIAENVAAAIYRAKPYAIDISSGVETDGGKDIIKIAQLTNIVRRLTT